jgi:hypothetical protein
MMIIVHVYHNKKNFPHVSSSNPVRGNFFQTKKKKFFFSGVPQKMCRKTGNLHTYFFVVNKIMNFLDLVLLTRSTFFGIFLKNARPVRPFKIILKNNS